MDPFEFSFELWEFDFNLLAIDKSLLETDPKLLRDAVKAFFTDNFRKMGGEATVEADSDLIRVRWVPAASHDTKKLLDLAVSLLKQGAFKQATPILELLSHRFPEDETVHFNYGMMLSDQGLFEEAIRHLLTAVTLSPAHADAWNALGVAHLRSGNEKEAVGALERSYILQPDNPYTLRNLGGLLAKDNPQKGLPYLEKAASLLPRDQQTLYGYGLCLVKLKKTDEADEVFRRTVDISPFTQVAELCRKERSLIATRNLRAIPGQLRMDAAMYCLAAMEIFAREGSEARQRITFEIALLGRSGLDINDPTPKYSLSGLSGKYSGLQLVSYMYVGFKQIDPCTDTGIDLSKEYEAAKSLFSKEEKNN